MPLPRYDVHEYSNVNTLVQSNLNMIGLVVNEYVTTESMAELVEKLEIGDEQLSDKNFFYIRRVS